MLRTWTFYSWYKKNVGWLKALSLNNSLSRCCYCRTGKVLSIFCFYFWFCSALILHLKTLLASSIVLYWPFMMNGHLSLKLPTRTKVMIQIRNNFEEPQISKVRLTLFCPQNGIVIVSMEEINHNVVESLFTGQKMWSPPITFS